MQASWWRNPFWVTVAALGLLAGCAELLRRPAAVKDPIVQRRALMKLNIRNLKAIKRLLDAGKVAQVSPHARQIVATAAAIPVRFRKKALSPKSRARPEIWDKWMEFSARAAALGLSAKKLDEVAAKGDLSEAKKTFGRMAKNCGACHRSFRKKKKAS